MIKFIKPLVMFTTSFSAVWYAAFILDPDFVKFVWEAVKYTTQHWLWIV